MKFSITNTRTVLGKVPKSDNPSLVSTIGVSCTAERTGSTPRGIGTTNLKRKQWEAMSQYELPCVQMVRALKIRD